MYLDANAHVPLCQAAKEFLIKNDDLGHPSAIHSLGRKAANKIEECRNVIAEIIGAKNANQIIFTLGCTQAAEWALEILLSYKKNFPIYYSPLEHIALKDPIEKNQSNIFDKTGSYLVQLLELKNNYELADINENSKLICIHSHNETGLINNLNVKNAKFILSDMSQSLGKIPINVTELNIDIAIFGAHKFGGPTSIGFMYLKDTQIWQPYGSGGRYIMDRSGTPDVLGIGSATEALKNAIKTLPERNEKMKKFQNILEKGLEERGAKIIAKNNKRLPNTTFFKYSQYAVDKCLKMSEKGIYFGLGSACGSVHTGISPSLKALGENGDIYDFARISQWGEYDDRDASKFLEIFDKV